MAERKGTSDESLDPKGPLSLSPPTVAEVFGNMDNFDGIVAYIKTRNALCEEIVQLRKGAEDRKGHEKYIANIAAKGGAIYRDNRSLDELLETNTKIAGLQNQIATLDILNRNRAKLLAYGYKWMQKLLQGNQDAFRVKEAVAENPNLRVSFGSTSLRVITSNDPRFSDFTSFEPLLCWRMFLEEEISFPSFDLNIKYDFEKGTAQKIEPPSVMALTNSEVKKRLQLESDWYSVIFIVMDNSRRLESE